MKILLLCLLVSSSAFAGRYEFHMNQAYPNRSIMIDTTTGKIYKDICYNPGTEAGQCDFTAWTPEIVIDINTTQNAVNKKSNELRGLINEKKN